MQHLYPTEITPAEAAAGFRRVDFENPNSHLSGHPPTVCAVIYRIDASHRVVKMVHPGRPGHYYAVQMFGRFSFDPEGRRAKWLPRYTDYQEDDPVRLTGAVASWLAAHPDARYVAVDSPPDSGGAPA
jgi:hypothetical protein